MVRQAIEGQIGMLTCQVIELTVQLRVSQSETLAAQVEVAQLKALLREAAGDET